MKPGMPLCPKDLNGFIRLTVLQLSETEIGTKGSKSDNREETVEKAPSNSYYRLAECVPPKHPLLHEVQIRTVQIKWKRDDITCLK